MNCSELDPLLNPYLDGEFGPSEQLELDEHFSSCSSCALRVHQERQFRQKLRCSVQNAAFAQVPPASLRQNVLAGIRGERRRAQMREWAKASAAVLVLASAGVGYRRLRAPARQSFVEDAARWHAKRLPFEIQKESHEQVEAWFGGKLDHHVSVPHLHNATMSGARLSNVKDHPAAYISYQADTPSSSSPKRVGVFVFDDAKDEIQAKSLPGFELDTSNGYNVAIWRDGEIVYELVSDLDEADIRNMLTERTGSDPPPPKPSIQIQPASLQK
jgi:anti-sigma factor RsiW